jgi:hypothetical protein
MPVLPVEQREVQVDNRVLALAETRTHILHGAKKLIKGGKMETEAARLKRKRPQEGGRKTHLTLTGPLIKGI